MDPFWVPTTVEELEDLGEKADRANVAKIYEDSEEVVGVYLLLCMHSQLWQKMQSCKRIKNKTPDSFLH
jgi:hypothetical protein